MLVFHSRLHFVESLEGLRMRRKVAGGDEWVVVIPTHGEVETRSLPLDKQYMAYMHGGNAFVVGFVGRETRVLRVGDRIEPVSDELQRELSSVADAEYEAANAYLFPPHARTRATAGVTLAWKGYDSAEEMLMATRGARSDVVVVNRPDWRYQWRWSQDDWR